MTGASVIAQVAAFIRPLISLALTCALFRYASPFQFEEQHIFAQVWQASSACALMIGCYGGLMIALWSLAGRPEGAESYTIRRVLKV